MKPKLKHFSLMIVSLLNLSACDSFTEFNMLDKALQSGEPYFSILYNKSFAQRFSLNEKKASVLSDNLQAIAIEINRVNTHYTCELHIYIDDNLDIHEPVVGEYYLEKSMAEHFFIYGYNDKDQSWNSKAIDKNSMQIRFDSTPEVKSASRFTRTLSYNKIHRSFLPGLTVVTLNTHCGIFNEAYYPADIWIQKQNVGDYLVGNDGREEIKNKQNNHRFPIPIALIKQAQPYIKIAEEKNMKRLLSN